MTDYGHTYDNSQEGRVGNWMQTYGGRQFWPLDPRPEDVRIGDIAHALSNACRYAGHCEGFYSVAEHSIYVSQVVPAEDALCGLLHDATETYLVDIPRPIKPYLTGYKDIEDKLWLAIAAAFNLPAEMPISVKEADNTVLLAEAEQIMKPHPAPWNVPGEPADVKIQLLSPEQARKAFIDRFWELV